MIADQVDALLVVSFGAPEDVSEVRPFLERVAAGRGIPEERLAAVEKQYETLGGASPLNAANRQLVEQLRDGSPSHWLGEKVYLGNRNTEPFISDTLAQMASDGVRRAAVFITSAFSSYSGCRMYRENLADGLNSSKAEIDLTILPRYHDKSQLAEIWADRIEEVWPDSDARLLFATHSLPVQGSKMYVEQHRALAARIVDLLEPRLGSLPWELVFQSRSGSPKTPWLEPDVSNTIGTVAGQTRAVVLAPIGFSAPNLEIAWDLDRVAAQTAMEAGLEYRCAEPPQGDPRFVEMIMASLKAESARRCLTDCCPNPRGPRPAIA